MIDEQLEFQIAQYADGTLPAAEAAALEKLLADNADARALLDGYRRLDATLKRSMPLPAINWDRLADHLSHVVAEEDRAATTPIAWPLRNWGKVAAAASIFLVLGTMALWHLKPAKDQIAVGPPNQPVAPPNTAVAIIEVTGPAAESATQPAVTYVDIVPSEWARQTNFGVAETVVYRPTRVTIASGQVDRQDTGRLPF